MQITRKVFDKVLKPKIEREFPVVSGPVWKFDPNGRFRTEFELNLPLYWPWPNMYPLERGRVVLENSVPNFHFFKMISIISITEESVTLKMGYGFI